MQSGLTIQRSQYKEAVEWDEDAPAEKKFLPLRPKHIWLLHGAASPTKHLSIALSGNYNGSMLVGHAAGSGVEKPIAVQTPSFFTLSLKQATISIFTTSKSTTQCRHSEYKQHLPTRFRQRGGTAMPLISMDHRSHVASTSE